VVIPKSVYWKVSTGKCLRKVSPGKCLLESVYEKCLLESVYWKVSTKSVSGKVSTGKCLRKVSPGKCLLESVYEKCLLESVSGKCLLEVSPGRSKEPKTQTANFWKAGAPRLCNARTWGRPETLVRLAVSTPHPIHPPYSNDGSITRSCCTRCT